MVSLSSRCFVALFIVALPVTVVAQQRAASAADRSKANALSTLEASATRYATIARQIWSFAEVGYQEEKSAALLSRTLEDAGFSVKRGVAGIPTAFVASHGSGKPVIAIIGEYDALPGLSQDAVPEKRVIVDGGAGHACGHHLFGTASTAAAIAVKEWMSANHVSGTLRFYGTPAEEGGSGKVFMVLDKLFADVDVALAWHPGDRNAADPNSTLATVTAKFRFRGISSHAAASPERGRSALDGVEAMNHMVNLMREHVPSDARIHYVITNGGRAPNVVPDMAEVYYYARHNDMQILDGLWERIVNASKGAALGTDTKVDHEYVGAVYNVLPNEYLTRVMHGNLERVGGVTYSADERSFATTIRTTLPESRVPLGSEASVLPLSLPGVTSASSDMGDVSWNVPTVQLTAATWVPGTPAHSWQAVAAGGTSIGAKGMMIAAKTLTLTAIDLFTDPAHVTAAREEFSRKTQGFSYTSRLQGRKPMLDYRR